jgi:hypothetical protein
MTTLHAPSSLRGPIAPLPSSILGARAALGAATAEYLAIPDDALERPWAWGEHDSPDGVRYGIYRAAETVEAAAAEVERTLAGAPARPPGAVLIAPATVARWALQGRLASLPDATLDRVPRDGEWTARQTLGHTVDGQRSYGWFSRWWVSQPVGDDRPSRVTDEAEAASRSELPGEDAEGAGTVAEIRARLDAVVDEWALRFAPADDVTLAMRATWAGIPVDIAFRLGRWASHIAEHTVQLDKILAWLDQHPREVERIVREVHVTWGRLESRLFPATSTPPEVDAILARMSTTLVAEARSTRAAAEA